MKVKELIEELKKLKQEKEVWVASDEEGNDFHSLQEVAIASGEEDQTGKRIRGYIIYPAHP